VNVFTIVTIVKPRQEAALTELLAKTDPCQLLGHIPTLHFASFIVFPAEKLATAQSRLVFEINVDGSAEEFISKIASDPAVAAIYAHCEGCLSARYLQEHIRRPQVFHVGTPYRTAASIKSDKALRDRLDTRLFALDGLARLLERPAAGVQEYWTWELLKPWIAWALGLFTAPMGWWLFAWVWRNEHGLCRHAGAAVIHSFAHGGIPAAYHLFRTTSGATYYHVLAAFGMFLFLGLLVAGALWLSFDLWFTALPMMRERVKPWVRWLILATATSAVIRVLAADHRGWAIGVWLSFAWLFVFNAYSRVQIRRNARLVDIRPSGARSIASVWADLIRFSDRGDRRPAWWRRLWNWRSWFVSYFVVLGVLVAIHRVEGPIPWYTVRALALLYAMKALWLSVLVGWPARDTRFGFRPLIVGFIASVTAGAAWAAIVLTELHVPSPFLAAIVLITIFSLWAIFLPSPAVSSRPLTRAEAAELADQEDRDVQNHMAALVVIKSSVRPFRVWVLKTFLGILNAIFFRAWLPDFCKGKLFKLPTVHACQWLLLDGRNYLFLSNYDDSWTKYLDDFGQQLTTGIQKIWGQGEGNPGTTDLDKFKAFARSTMVPYALWYQAYPGLSVRQIWNNEIIRRELGRSVDEEAMARAVRRFAAAPDIPADQFAHARVN
jgi:hypothetical protein